MPLCQRTESGCPTTLVPTGRESAARPNTPSLLLMMTGLISSGRNAVPVYSALGKSGRLALLFAVAMSCTASSCQGSSVQMQASLGAQAHTTDLDDYVTWDRDLVFSDSAVSGEITVFLDSAGGFVVADGGQAQVRVYDDNAQLQWSAGQRGEGPNDFNRLTSAVRTPGREVIAIDSRGKLVFYDSTGKHLLTTSTGLTLAYNGWLLNDSTLLISGRDVANPESPLLHLWNLRQGRITKSFFQTPPHDPRFDQAYQFSGWAYATLASDSTLAVVFPLSDTLYLYHVDGSPLGKHRLPLDNFRRMREPRARDDSPEARIAWRGSYTRIARVHGSEDGSLYVQYFNLEGLEPVWGISRVFVDRGRLHKSFEVARAHELLGISRRNSELYFLRADLLESTVWSVAHLSR